MNAAEVERKRTGETETFVIAKTDEGFRVCSPMTPGKQYLVTGLPDDPRCTCPEFAHHERDSGWYCQHVLAVRKQMETAGNGSRNGTPVPAGGRGSSEPPQRTEKKTSGGRNGKGSLMILKRSVSPDGRIDALSVEFSCPLGTMTTEELKECAGKILALQGDIADGFLKNGNGKKHGNGNGQDAPDAVPGQLIAVASMDGKWGRRLFINVLVNGQMLKLFGSEKQLADAVSEAGFPSVAERLVDGYTLNLPCRVVTKPSPNGRYVNVERILSAQAGGSNGKSGV